MTSAASESRLGQVGRASFVYIGLSIAQRTAGLLMLPLVTRAMAPEEFGAVAVMVAASGLASVVLGAAIETVVFREAARNDHRGPATLGLCQLWLYVVVPAAGLLGAAAMSGRSWSFMGANSSAWAAEFLAVCLSTAVVGFGLALLRARERVALFALVSAVVVVSAVASRLVLVILLDHGVLGWALSDLVTAALSFGVCLVVARIPRVPADHATVRRLLVFALPLVPHRLAFWSLASLDRLLLGLVASQRDVGVYALAANLSAAVMMVLAELNRAVLVEYARADFPAPRGSLAAIVKVQVLVAVAGPAAALAVFTLLQDLIFGPGYEDSLVILAALTIGQVVYGIYVVPTNLLVQSAGISGYNWVGSCLGAACVAIGALLFGGQYGAMAIAAATSVGYVVMTLFAVGLTRRHSLSVMWTEMWPGSAAICIAVVALVLAVLPVVAIARWEYTTAVSSMVAATMAMALLALTILRTERGAAGEIRQRSRRGRHDAIG